MNPKLKVEQKKNKIQQKKIKEMKMIFKIILNLIQIKMIKFSKIIIILQNNINKKIILGKFYKLNKIFNFSKKYANNKR